MDQPDKIADSELPRIDQDKEVAPHAQEIEYALILQRMINVVSEDPEQMRLAIYQLARAKLKSDTGWANEVEKKRLTTALETAIQGVEKFSVVREERERLLPSPAAAQIGSDAPGAASSSSAATVSNTAACAGVRSNVSGIKSCCDSDVRADSSARYLSNRMRSCATC